MRMGLHGTTHVHQKTSWWRQGSTMSESDLLMITRLLVRQNRLPRNIGLGKEWIIILAMPSDAPAVATKLYGSTQEDLTTLYPMDAREITRTTRRRTTRYLLVRRGSLAMTYWLTLPARYRSDSIYLVPR